MRAGTIMIAGLMLMLSGCAYDRVDQGMKGSTSPAESGQHGASADQAVSLSPDAKAKKEHEIKPMGAPYSNGNTDATMEGSGNLAAQGTDPKAEQQRQSLMPKDNKPTATKAMATSAKPMPVPVKPAR